MVSRLNVLVALLLVTAACGGKKASEKSGSADKSQAASAAKTPDAGAAPAEPAGPKPIPAPPDVAAAPAEAEKTKSGLQSKVIKAGQAGEHPRAWDQVTVNYTGWTGDGKMFDSSLVARGPGHVPAPATFGLDGVIAGWTEGVQLMVPGETRRFWIPEELAYKGQMGAPQGTLVFDIELISIKKNPDPPPAPSDVAAAPADAQKTPSGLMWKQLVRGTGKVRPKPTDTVKVHYTGWTPDGKMFDSSVTRSVPAMFPVDKVIKGWSEGVQLMVTGEKRRFWVPEALAYAGRPGRPQGMLVFDVELVAIVTPETPKDVAAAPKDAAKTASGLASKLLKKGTGSEHPSPTSTVKVDYSGWTTDGKMFDSSITRGEAAEFPLNGVIAGWTEGLQLMVVGEQRRFWIPEALAYKGQPGAPAGTLVFDVELLEIKK